MTETITINRGVFNTEQIFGIEKIIGKKISNLVPIIEVVKSDDLTKEEKEISAKAEKDFLDGKTKSFEEVYEKCMK